MLGEHCCYLRKTELVKGTIRIFSSDPPCKDGNARFTTVSLNLSLMKNVEHFGVFLGLKEVIFRKKFYMFPAVEMRKVTLIGKPQLKIIRF